MRKILYESATTSEELGGNYLEEGTQANGTSKRRISFSKEAETETSVETTKKEEGEEKFEVTEDLILISNEEFSILKEENARLEVELELREYFEEEKPFVCLGDYYLDAFKILFFLKEKGTVTEKQLFNEVETKASLCETIANMCEGDIINYKQAKINLTKTGKKLASKFNEKLE